jgi:hypothetical protein
MVDATLMRVVFLLAAEFWLKSCDLSKMNRLVSKFSSPADCEICPHGFRWSVVGKHEVVESNDSTRLDSTSLLARVSACLGTVFHSCYDVGVTGTD